MSRIKIASFSPARAWTYVVLGLVMCAWIFAIYFPQPGTNWLDMLGENRVDAFFVIGVLVLMPLLALMDLVVLWQLLFGQGEAVWIVDGRLHFLDTYWGVVFSKISLGEVDHLSVKSPTAVRRAAVIVSLKNGRRLSIPTLILKDTAETIVARLTPCLTQQGAHVAQFDTAPEAQ